VTKPDEAKVPRPDVGPRPVVLDPESRSEGRKADAAKPASAGRSTATAGSKPASKTVRPTPVVEVRPIAQPAGMRRRHWGLVLSFVILVLLPILGSAAYLWGRAVDQYASTTGFTVRTEEGTSNSVLDGVLQFAGSTAGSDSDILYEFIQSQELIAAVDRTVDLRAIYTRNWAEDPVFSLWPDASIEDLVWYWNRVVRISHDASTGLIELRILAFTPEEARTVARAIVDESQRMINDLNATAQQDLRRYAEDDLQEAVERLKAAREALTAFRTRTQIVDPTADLQGQMGVVNNLQQQLAEALIELDLLVGTTSPDDPRITQAQRRIDVIRDRIARERESFAVEEVGGIGADYPTLMAEYESLSVDREFAEETYRVALAALDVARDRASRQTRYLAAYIRPTLAQAPEYPQRWVLLGLIALLLVLSWSILSLVYYSIRDRR
jgi:capsular polysaccharide transport system permease protein